MAKRISRYHVPAGSFQVCKRNPLILEAYLGTCVGLALYCSQSGSGGLIHLLLPEPISTQGGVSPEKYATTGLPMFYQSLIEAGAQPDKLTACLAGGALVGPLRQQDLDLDIGGRICEVVRAFLKSKNIQIDRSETGGFFTCCLSLDMENGRFAITPVGEDKLTDRESVPPPDPDEILGAMNRIKPIPQVALKILRLIDANEYDISAITEEILTDQVITARTLQLANSAMFATKGTIASLDHAVVYLGQNLLVRLVLTAAVQGYYEQTGMGYALCKGGIYHHSLGCAQTAELLARRTGREDPGRAYTAGLLHDIGKVVLDQYVSDAFPLFYRTLSETRDDILSIEGRMLGIDHTEAGGMLARQWSLPGAIENAIRHHHHPDRAEEDTELATLIFLADLIMSRFHSELEIERIDANALHRHLNALDLTYGDLAAIVERMPPIPTSTLDPAREIQGTHYQ